ncbi:probable disease resistance protein At1g58602 isoform X1 [Salvia miltiorrhiza]|uniref:probable disease resistance protein At1g58602 isoform X1 n=2 Tax=Salvia miltiorrhiza TaxID=226208 RepID=UPI0025AB81A5|nr:probable disease resistance protein At1g58602 isoform X1 [Salvia miltiorrhiza]XP_057811940.1 probable disease resistance protein At1g58602 isoform X1 [Salvia miltiorrhiza]XP_057811941.1 probable disease resistance protein At1g58602 isoform X1 [Salvia miltiorrhiza]XP_057811942.1 probable disease resistance protein At1g58602 isoform X1 [Salvia miltiorrhiza]XP_057811943.1 probable disease resistance protein At1g58602 isoform X1 [Salvia miltiorrhiza]
MAESAILVALETLRNLLLDEAKFLSGVGSQVKGLESQLKEMQCLLEDTDRSRQHKSKSVGYWILEIRDLVYQAEDVIEMYSVVQVSSRSGRGIRQFCQRFSCLPNRCCSLYKIGWEISEIRSAIGRVYKSIHEYGLRSIIQEENSGPASENQRWQRKTYSFETSDCFVGMEEDLKRLVSLTVDDNLNRVISVWGMGGLGKTTIVRKVYNHVDVKHAFDSFAWVCITQQCQIRFVLEEVIKQLMPQQKEHAMHLSDTELVEQLFQVQKEKRCLIVLDDLWKIEHRDCLLGVFVDSQILMTTRKQNVADVGLSYKLGLLSMADGWELLKCKAFPRNYIPPDFGLQFELFEEVGKKMVKICGYLPLVISLLGGILSKRRSLKEWELVNKNIDDYLFSAGSTDQDNKINAVILDLSYEDLPSYLKPCFLYMGQFVEDQYIYGDNLYMLWIAEGLISVENRASEETLMDVAKCYLSELASRCMVEIVAQETVSSKRYVSCHLHDVVRDLCLLKGKKEDFRLKVVNCQAQGGRFDVLSPSVLGIKTRYLAMHFRGEVEVEHDQLTTTHEETNQHIRSLKFICHSKQRKINFPNSVLEYFHNFKLVRVLVFEGCNFQRRKLPKEIGNLIHLRYLRLRNCVFTELPSSISNLIYLCTLDLFHSWDVRIPNVLHKLIRLKHLFLPDYRKTSNARTYQLSLEGLNKLETLIGFDSLFHDWKSVSRMKNLQRLRATVHDTKTLSEIIDDLNTNWNNLHESTLIIKDGCELTSSEQEVPILKKLFTCSNLHSLWIDMRMQKLQQEIETQVVFPRLVFLTVRNCKIEDDPMLMLEMLPCLESLCLWPCSYVGKKMTCRATGFCKLKTIQLWGLPNLTEWKVEKGAMPILSELEIRHCPKLGKVQDELRSITNLEELEISEIPGFGKWVSGRKRGVQHCFPCSFRHHPSTDWPIS